jgi:hypothetical protein
MKLLRIISVGSDVTNKLLMRFFRISHVLEKKLEYSNIVRQLFTDFKKAYDLVRRDVLCNILMQFACMQIKMCLNGRNNEVRIGKHLSDSFLMQNGLKLRHCLSTLL